MSEQALDEQKLPESSEVSDDDSDDDEAEEGVNSSDVGLLDIIFMKNLHINASSEKPKPLLDDVSFDGIAKYIASNKCKNIITMVGAGISTSAGIPDFRSPSSGLYANLEKYNLPSPEAMFSIDFFRENPEPFFQLAKELFPDKFKPTICHYFLRLLQEKDVLLRLYTQNIDTLERVAGISGDKIVEAHGTFHTSHCINTKCHTEYSLKWMKERIFSDIVPSCDNCNEVVKPDVVFFGENLPERFFNCVKEDFWKCDLLLIIGTSLTVQPFASLVESVSEITPRCLINKEKRGELKHLDRLLGLGSGMDFDAKTGCRDVAWIGLCDDGCLKLAEKLGWKDELISLHEEEHTKFDEKLSEDK